MQTQTMTQAQKRTPKQQIEAIQRYMIVLRRLHPFNPEQPRTVEPKAAHLALKSFIELLQVRGTLREQVRELAAQFGDGGLYPTGPHSQIVALAPEVMRQYLLQALKQFEGERRLLNYLLDASKPSGGRRFTPKWADS